MVVKNTVKELKDSAVGEAVEFRLVEEDGEDGAAAFVELLEATAKPPVAWLAALQRLVLPLASGDEVQASFLSHA